MWPSLHYWKQFQRNLTTTNINHHHYRVDLILRLAPAYGDPSHFIEFNTVSVPNVLLLQFLPLAAPLQSHPLRVPSGTIIICSLPCAIWRCKVSRSCSASLHRKTYPSVSYSHFSVSYAILRPTIRHISTYTKNNMCYTWRTYHPLHV